MCGFATLCALSQACVRVSVHEWEADMGEIHEDGMQTHKHALECEQHHGYAHPSAHLWMYSGDGIEEMRGRDSW